MRRARVGLPRTRLRPTGVTARRVAVTIVAVVLVVAAEIAATLSATAVSRPRTHHAAMVGARSSPAPYGGEPRIPAGATAPAAARAAAIRFVRDYARWSDRRLLTIPAEDATPRVIPLLERQPTDARLSAGDAADSVRIAAVGPQRYMVTSAVGNFLVDKGGSRWLVVSLPGD